MKKYSKLIVAAIVALIFIGTFVFLYEKSQPKPVEYTEFTPKMADVLKTTVITGVVYRDFNNTLYSVIAMVVSSMALDRVVYGMDYSKVALIITEKYEAIATAIDGQLDRGVTLLKGQGYYKRQDKMVLLSAVKRKQLAELKELVMDIDPDAFIILQDAHQVLGDGFKRYDRNEL